MHVHTNSNPTTTRPASTARRRKVLLTAATCLLSVALLAGCEDDEANTMSATNGATVAASQARRLDEALLAPGDLSGGWERDHFGAADVLAPRCDGIDLVDAPATIGRAPRITHHDEEIENVIIVFEDAEDARRHLDRFTGSDAQACLADFVRRSALDGRGVELQSVDVTTSRMALADEGDEAATHQVTARVEAVGIDLDAHLDVVAVREGRAIALFSFLELGERLDGPQKRAVEAVIERIRDQGLT